MLPGRLLVIMLAVSITGGCAMKRDIRDLQEEMADMRVAQERARAEQDRLLREIQRQNLTILDSLRVQDVRLRGDFTNQLVQIGRQLVQIQELTGQGQRGLAELRQQIQANEEAMRRAAAAAAATASAGDPTELFATAEGALERGSLGTARAGFQEFVSTFPEHARAPEARLFLGQILEEEDSFDDALEVYNDIVELHKDAPQAPTAWYRSALIERQRGNDARARTMLNQLTAAYPRSPEATSAREELRRMR